MFPPFTNVFCLGTWPTWPFERQVNGATLGGAASLPHPAPCSVRHALEPLDLTACWHCVGTTVPMVLRLEPLLLQTNHAVF